MFIKKTLFEEEENIGGFFISIASENSLAKNWLSKEEEKAWKHLQKEA